MAGTPTGPASDPPEAPPPEARKPLGPRIVAGLGALVLLFVALIAILVVADVADTTPCDDVQTAADLNDEGECYDRSAGVKTIVLILGSIGALATVAAAGLALAYAIRGRGGRPLLQAIGVAVVLLALTMIIG